jgi:hypothetical protein
MPPGKFQGKQGVGHEASDASRESVKFSDTIRLDILRRGFTRPRSGDRGAMRQMGGGAWSKATIDGDATSL